MSTEADNGITLDTGSEVISGSTRLKAGTAQIIVLNIFSSAAMVRLNKAYGNLMVDLKATNAKLMRRTINLTILATGTDEATAREMLEVCEFQVKVAIVAITKKSKPSMLKRCLPKPKTSCVWQWPDGAPMPVTAGERNPWWRIPTLYFGQRIPYVVVMTRSVILYKNLGLSNSDIALYTSWLYLPRVIKPLWSPVVVVDMFRTKRLWIVSLQLLIGAALALVALTIPTAHFFRSR